MDTADTLIARLNLAPHPEGGHYRQTWIADTTQDKRACGTCILFLLKSGERSHWHRVDAVEIWHFGSIRNSVYGVQPMRLKRIIG